MDSDFATKIQNILSNPEAMSKITAIASSLGGNSADRPSESQPEPEKIQPASTQSENMPMFPFQQSDPRISLLNSVKPLLKEEKRGKVDSLLTALTMASMLKNFKK